MRSFGRNRRALTLLPARPDRLARLVKQTSDASHRVDQCASKRMKTITTQSLGYDIPVPNVPETLDEAVAAFGGADKLIGAAVNTVLQHNMKGEIRDHITSTLAKVLGVTRETKKVKSPTKADPAREIDVDTETDAEFVKTSLANANTTTAATASQVIPAEGFKFDATSTPREPGAPKGAGKILTGIAEKIIALGEAAYSKTVSTLLAANPGLVIVTDESTGAPTVDSLALAIKANQDRVAKESLAGLGIPA